MAVLKSERCSDITLHFITLRLADPDPLTRCSSADFTKWAKNFTRFRFTAHLMVVVVVGGGGRCWNWVYSQSNNFMSQVMSKLFSSKFIFLTASWLFCKRIYVNKVTILLLSLSNMSVQTFFYRHGTTLGSSVSFTALWQISWQHFKINSSDGWIKRAHEPLCVLTLLFTLPQLLVQSRAQLQRCDCTTEMYK